MTKVCSPAVPSACPASFHLLLRTYDRSRLRNHASYSKVKQRRFSNRQISHRHCAKHTWLSIQRDIDLQGHQMQNRQSSYLFILSLPMPPHASQQ